MKITQAHYDRLKSMYTSTDALSKNTFSHIQGVYVDEHRRGAIKAKDIQKRCRWDLFWCVSQDVRGPFMRELYEYLNDDHIDSALRKICGELN